MNIPIQTITMHKGNLKANISHKLPAMQRPRVTCSREAYNVLLPAFDGIIDYREIFVILLLNRNNRVICMATISEGGTGGTVVDAKIIFQHAIMANASAIVLAHNHPSGQILPSSADTDITAKVREGGRLIDIGVSDHLIITEQAYYSFTDNGLITF
jgi:DNA repair protein RadC